MAEHPFSYSLSDPETPAPCEGRRPNALQENTPAILQLYTRDLKSFVSPAPRWLKKGNLVTYRQSLPLSTRRDGPIE
jgi:hypothetical protein